MSRDLAQSARKWASVQQVPGQYQWPGYATGSKRELVSHIPWLPPIRYTWHHRCDLVALFSGLPHCYSLFYIHKWGRPSLVPRPPPFFVLRFAFIIIHGSGPRPGNTYHTRWTHLPYDQSHQHKLWVVHLFHVRSVQYLTFSFLGWC